jgi:hypothetical protein
MQAIGRPSIRIFPANISDPLSSAWQAKQHEGLLHVHLLAHPHRTLPQPERSGERAGLRVSPASQAQTRSGHSQLEARSAKLSPKGMNQ